MNFKSYKEKERQVKEKRSMKDTELHPAHGSFNSKGDKKLLKVFSKSLIPPVCNVTPREHKNEMSKHFSFF